MDAVLVLQPLVILVLVMGKFVLGCVRDGMDIVDATDGHRSIEVSGKLLQRTSGLWTTQCRSYRSHWTQLVGERRWLFLHRDNQP